MQQADKRGGGGGNWRWQVAARAGAGAGDGLAMATLQEHVSDFPISRFAPETRSKQQKQEPQLQPQMMPLGRVAVPRRSWSCSRHLLQCRVLWFPAGWACQGRRSKWGRVVLIGLSGLENLCGRQQQAKNQQQFSMFCNYTKLRLSCPLCHSARRYRRH